MQKKLTRRAFLGTSGLFAAGFAATPSWADSANERLDLAIVGCGNKGWHNVTELASQNVVALCDVDTRFLGPAAERYPHAKQFRDYRRMLDEIGAKVDAVVVSTADHTHAPATARALDMGKPVYCEKPLTHTVTEARAVAKLAAAKSVATQMGTQVHASDNYRRVVEIVRSGILGTVTEVYNWCNKGWSDGRFAAWDKPVPANLDWDLWLGPARERRYSPDIHPGNWRRFWEYGSGTLGDMGCHVMDLPFWALGLGQPTRIKAEGPTVHADGAPEWVLVEYEFARQGQSPLRFYWADGGKHQEKVRTTMDHDGKPLSSWGLGVLFVGEKGMLAADYGRRQLLPKGSLDSMKVEQSIPDSIGHWNEWVAACKTGSPTSCNFGYSGNLTETVLLGTIAYRAGGEMDWNGANLKTSNSAAQQLLRKEYRKGFEVAGL